MPSEMMVRVHDGDGSIARVENRNGACFVCVELPVSGFVSI